jgi:hypothetical protein
MAGFAKRNRRSLEEIGVNHPGMDQLAAFAHGKLDEAEAKKIAVHLAGCTTCEEFLDNLPDDPLLSLIRPLFTPRQRHPSATVMPCEFSGHLPSSANAPSGLAGGPPA